MFGDEMELGLGMVIAAAVFGAPWRSRPYGASRTVLGDTVRDQDDRLSLTQQAQTQVVILVIQEKILVEHRRRGQ